MCYVNQYGHKYYDMETARAFREDLEVETTLGNVTSLVLHQGDNFWILNKLPWFTFGIHQCACVHIREGGTGKEPIYPIQYNWVDQLTFVGRERLLVEYISEELVLDHWVYGPHHVWTRIESGNIVRMWQPFNGLQIYPSGVCKQAL